MNSFHKKPAVYGLYGEKELSSPDFIHCEPIEYRSKLNSWQIKPHLHTNLFHVFLIEEGRITFCFEHSRQVAEAPALVTIPENIVHALEVSEDVHGLVLTVFSCFPDTLLNSIPNNLGDILSLQFYSSLAFSPLLKPISENMDGLYRELQSELPEKSLVVHIQMVMLLSNIYRLMQQDAGQLTGHNSSCARYFMAFYKAVKQACSLKKTVAGYAAGLHITPAHLNRICRHINGKTALQVVHDFLMTEAKKYLEYTDYSIAEIAYRLHFDDAAYF